ncbi:hypothetical protein [Caballeronia sordidicola]|uniref:hypothetical protein n=1 Tax=Caballeronia sordidicola TaxID=196367 RepID=UPI000A3AF654|nr:hypothetical protein [Caballeronia sordidicola]
MVRKVSHFSLTDDKDKKIRELEEALWLAHYRMINLMAYEKERILSGYHHVEDLSSAYRWLGEAANALIKIADAKPGFEMGDPGTRLRAVCPLCGDGAQTPYVEGFAVPIGLRRHLMGEYNSQQCTVMAAALWLARDSARRASDPKAPQAR